MAMTNYETQSITTPPLSTQLDQLETGLKNNPRKAQQMANVPRPTIDALVAQRVLNETSKKRREIEEELFVNKAGNPQTTVNDDLKMQNVALTKDLTNLEMQKVMDAGAIARQQQAKDQSALQRLIAASKPKASAGGIGAILPGNRPPMGRPTGGVNMLAANNMRGMPSGGITQRPPMPMPMARGAGGGIVAFKEGTLVDANAEDEEVAAIADAVSEKREEEQEDSGILATGSEGIVGALQNIVDARKAQQEKEKQEILDRVAADKGFTSDAFINRLLAFGGAENFGQGLIQSGRAGQQYQREQEARTQRELDRISGRESNLDALLLQSLGMATEAGIKESEVALKGDELAFLRNMKNKELALEYRRLGVDSQKVQGDLRLRERALTNEEAKTELQKSIAEVDKEYKRAQAEIGRMEAGTKREDLAVRLAAHRNDYLRLAKERLLDLGANATADDVAKAMIDLGNMFDARVKQDQATFTKKSTPATTSQYVNPLQQSITRQLQGTNLVSTPQRGAFSTVGIGSLNVDPITGAVKPQ